MAELPQTSSIEERAQLVLNSSQIFDLRCLRVEQCNGNLVISGSVSQFYHKQLAQELILALGEDVEVINSIHVQ